MILKPVMYYSFGLYRRMWIYASTQELKLIVTAVTAAEVPVVLAILAVWRLDAFVGFPRLVPIIDWALSILAVGGLRMAVRLVAESQPRQPPVQRPGPPQAGPDHWRGGCRGAGGA